MDCMNCGYTRYVVNDVLKETCTLQVKGQPTSLASFGDHW